MDIEDFISRWTAREGGAERANYQGFLYDLCEVLGVERPQVSGADHRLNDYAFERAVRPRASDGGTAPKRIDLYKKGCFILEAKQSRLPGGKNAIPGYQPLPLEEVEPLGKRDRGPAWDVMMQNARKQAEGYVFLLDADQPAPPFIITCDVGNCLELFADFSGTGRAYNQFPDRKGFRIYMDDLRHEDVRTTLATVWTDPQSLDPTKTSARVTRDIARRLAQVSKALEERGCNAEDVAHFLMRCLFTMFAEDTDLLPRGSFCHLLERCVEDPTHFPHRLKSLWADMDRGAEFSAVIDDRVRHFNGGLFKETTVFELGKEEIGELLTAARADWKLVDPAIFGTLLEQALDKDERRRLGAHYTPRSYVQRLVDVTVMEPLRADWQAALTRAEQARDDGDEKEAVALLRAFHHQLCTTRVLDPACGTGNFLYVALEMMKQLEGEVLQALTDMGDRQASLTMTGEESVDPHQFLGLELNPRAAAIAELVIWIGYLQWHYRNHESHPAEPILRAFKNINFGHREGYDAVLTWDGYPVPAVEVVDGKRVDAYPNPRRPVWPVAEFIVGNPPFIGNKRMREYMGSSYVEGLRAAYGALPESIDLVMYWWDRAASALCEKRPTLRRFGFVTTNSISQTFNRRVIEKYLVRDRSLSLAYAVPNHPWTKVDSGSAAVRISMTVARPGIHHGVQATIIHEEGLDTDEPNINFQLSTGQIASDLSLAAGLLETAQLLANEDLAHQGVTPLGEGFRLSRREVDHLGYDANALPSVVRRYLIGRDLVQRPEERYIIDFYSLTESEARTRYPDLYQVILERVKPERLLKNRKTYRDLYWIFAEPRSRMREAMSGLEGYIATCRTAKFRLFSMLSASYVPDAKIVAICVNNHSVLSVLSSNYHTLWSEKIGARLGVGDDLNYNHSDCFAKYPFPQLDGLIGNELAQLGAALEEVRSGSLGANPDLTLTGLYNLLEKVRTSADLTPAEEDAKQRGRVLILKELHDKIDTLTAQAYGWPTNLSNEAVLDRLVALNAERAREEAAGHVRWLRPEYQIPRFAKGTQAKSGELDLGEAVVAMDKGLPAFPTDRYEQPLAIEALLAASSRPMAPAEIARGFKRGGKRIEQRVVQVLTTLVRYGRVTNLGDGRYAARRAA